MIEDPWRVFAGPPDPSGCHIAFRDSEFPGGERDTLYDVRAIEASSPAVSADPLHRRRDASGCCVETNPCFGRIDENDYLAETEERAWSSPIFVDFAGAATRAS